MTVPSILLPLFVQVGLTFAIVFGFVFARTSAGKAGAIGADGTLPPRVQQLSNSLSNQFELPVLFYVLTILALMTRKADLLFVIMAWIFVLSRIGHAAVHTTSNSLALRGPIFGLGAVVLLLMWIIFAVRILLVLE